MAILWEEPVSEATCVFRTVENDEWLDFQRFAEAGVWISDGSLAPYAMGREPAHEITEQQALEIIRRWLDRT